MNSAEKPYDFIGDQITRGVIAAILSAIILVLRGFANEIFQNLFDGLWFLKSFGLSLGWSSSIMSFRRRLDSTPSADLKSVFLSGNTRRDQVFLDVPCTNQFYHVIPRPPVAADDPVTMS